MKRRQQYMRTVALKESKGRKRMKRKKKESEALRDIGQIS